MPVFTNPIDARYDGRTQTQLVVSEGRAPAEKWLPSEATNNTVQFNYAFGPENNKEVVIPKGKIVAAAGVEYDTVTEKYIPRIKISGTADLPLGVNHHNVYQRKRDKFSGNEPTIITRDYIRVPLFINDTEGAAKTAAAGIKFGAMWLDADPANKAAVATAAFGKYVVSDEYGNFQLSSGTDIADGKVVGQVYGLELDVPPAGYLEYFTEMTAGELYDLIQSSREVPSAGRTTADSGSLSIDTFPVGTSYLKSKEDLAFVLKNFRAGIPFLTDGYFKARTVVTMATLADAQILDVRATGNVTIAGDKAITVTDPVGAMIFVKLKDKLATDRLEDGDTVANHPELGGVANTFEIRIMDGSNAGAGALVAEKDYHIDYYNNMIVIYPTAAIADKDIKITATLLVNQIPGVPTNWDFKGVFGEARILLQK